jgi:hypothetical protein
MNADMHATSYEHTSVTTRTHPGFSTITISQRDEYDQFTLFIEHANPQLIERAAMALREAIETAKGN